MRTAHIFAGSSEAEDAAQEAFIKAYNALERFDSSKPFKPWLLRIVVNEAINKRRSSQRRAAADLRLREDRRPGDAAPSPEAAALQQEERQHLLEAVKRLDEPQRDVVACRYFLQLDEAETAEALGIRRGTVKSRLSRALARLRKELEPEVAT